jgi:hypothetical protein
MTDMTGRKNFKVFNQDFIVDERYNVTKELGQGAYGIVWYVSTRSSISKLSNVTHPREALGLLETGFQKALTYLK